MRAKPESLPAGKACGMCRKYRRCAYFSGARHIDRVCIFSPAEFAESAAQVNAPAPAQKPITAPALGGLFGDWKSE